MRTEEDEYSCLYTTQVLEENMWNRWRAEQAVIKQDTLTELWMEIL
jgi:hypothetical protein